MSLLEGDGQQQPQSCLCTLEEQGSGNCASEVKTPDWSNAPIISKAGSKVQRSGRTEIVVSALKWLYIWGNGLVSCHSCLILLGLLLLWTKCRERTGKTKTIYHFTFFASVVRFIFSYLTHEMHKSGPSCSTLNHLLFHLTGTWFQKSLFFQSYSWDGYDPACIVTLPVFALESQFWNEERLWTCFPDLCVNQWSLPSKGLFVCHGKCKHHSSETPCYKAYSL